MINCFQIHIGKPGKIKLPIIPGHEFSGKVVAMGEGAKDHHGVDIGDLVVAEQIVTCNNCRFCLKGTYEVCPNSGIFGFRKNFPGAMAQYMIFSQNARVHKVPQNVDPVAAAFAEPLRYTISETIKRIIISLANCLKSIRLP